MAKWRGDAAPNPEWVLMYRRGLSRKKIAGLTGAPPSTVDQHIALAKALDPDLQSEHAAASESAATPGMHRVQALHARPGRRFAGGCFVRGPQIRVKGLCHGDMLLDGG